MGKRVKAMGTRMTALLVIAGIAVLCLGGVASAAKVHVFSKTFGEAKGELSLTTESGVAVSEQTGEVYVADTGHSRVAKFSSLGIADGSLATIPTPTFVAVDNSTTSPSRGDVYVVSEGDRTITKLTSSGVPVAGWGTEEGGEKKGTLTGLGEINGIAVNSEGSLWVFNLESPSQASVIEFGQAGGEQLHSFTVHAHGDPSAAEGVDPNQTPNQAAFLGFGVRKAAGEELEAAGLAIDSHDQTYVYSEFLEAYIRLDSDGEPVFFEGQSYLIGYGVLNSGIATEAITDDVYAGLVAGGNSSLFRLASDGAQLERFAGQFEGVQPVVPPATQDLTGVSGIAVNASTGDIFVADPTAKSPRIVVYSLEEVEPPSATLEVGEVTKHSAKLIGHIDPNAIGGRAHEVAWRVVCTPTCPGHAKDSTPSYIEADGTEHLVEVTLEGLPAGTDYSVRLQVENRGGKAEPEPVEAFTTAPDAPSVADEAASEIHRGGARLNAKINPSGATTTYHFEYMTKAAFEAEGFGGAQTRVTPEPEPIAPLKPDPEDPEKVPPAPRVSELVGDLEPATDYVYRAVATNSVGTTNGEPVYFRSQVGEHPLQSDCPNQILRTGEGARLPDCRAYELVSPTDKAGSLVEPYESGLQAAVNGSGVTWYTGGTATGIPVAGGAHQGPAFYLSTRAGERWTTQRLLAPETLGAASFLVGLTADQRYGLIQASGKGGVEPALYLLDATDQVLTTVVPAQVGKQIKRAFSFAGASDDDSLFFFESRLQLTTNAAAGKDNLYVWDRLTSALSLVGVLPGAKGEAPAGGSFGGAYAWWRPNSAGPNFGGAEQGMYVEAIHAISESGERAYFTAGETGQLYLRSGLTGSKPISVRVSVAKAGVSDPHGQQPAAFQEATPEGDMAYFLSSGKLTADANTGPNDEGSDLYRYNADAKATEALVDVTPLNGGAGAQVQGLLGVSADGKSGFLVAKGMLETGGTEGENNIYHFEETGGGFAYRFVATLANSGDERNWSGLSTRPKTARVSEDGGTLLFLSRSVDGEPLGNCASQCAQVYRYSLGEEALACLSCNPTGEGPAKFGAELAPEFSPIIGPENVPFEGTGNPSGWEIYGTLPRNLSSTGTRVFFETAETLLPEDRNGQGCKDPYHCYDVYEWEAAGSGSCQVVEINGGCLYLLSSGESGESSHFLDASADGTNAFMITGSQLVPADKDELSDVYGVRVDGGLASQHVIPTESCRSAESCKGAGQSPPPPGFPGTQSFQGPGNPPARRCKQGAARKHAKCVTKHHKAKKRKHHSKKSRTTAKKRSGGTK